MLNSIMSLGAEELTEDLTGTPPAETVSESVIVDPDTSVDNAILEYNEAERENDDLVVAIDAAERTRATLVEIGDILESSVEDDGNGIKPTEAEVLNIAIEGLLKSMGWHNKKPTLAIENFGQTMSRKDGTKLAIEDINSLVSQIETQSVIAGAMRYRDQVSLVQINITIRERLLAEINQTDVKSKEYFNGGTYSPESNGRDLAAGNIYTSKIFNTLEAAEGKMPTAAVLSGLEALKNRFSTQAYVPLIKEVREALQAVTGNSTLTVDNIKSVGNALIAKYNNLFETGKKFTDKYDLNYAVVLPLGGGKLEVRSRILSEDSQWWYGNSTIEQEVIKEGTNPTLGALSNAEIDIVITTLAGLLQSGEFNAELVGLIEDLIAYDAAYNKLSAALIAGDEVNCGSNNVSGIVEALINFFNLISKYEAAVFNALVNYIKDSIQLHSSNTSPAAAPAGTEATNDAPAAPTDTPAEPSPAANDNTSSTEGDNATGDTNTPPADNNASETPPASSEGGSDDTSGDDSNTTS